MPNETVSLSHKQQEKLLDIAREAITSKFSDTKIKEKLPVEESVYHESLATFVTLKKEDQLRGCIGNLQPIATLLDSVWDNAIQAAFHDHRFSPLAPQELSGITIEISVLSNPQKLKYTTANELLEKLRPGIDGVILGDGRRQATFLPQVWEQIKKTEEFLNHLCSKAGMEPDRWRGGELEVKTYQVLSFSEDRK